MREFFSGLFGALGGLLMAVGIVLALWCQGRQPSVPRQAAVIASEWMDALSQGNLERASGCLYGQPSLVSEPEDDLQSLVDDAYRRSLSCTAQSLCQPAEDGARQEMQITTLDLAAAWDEIEKRAETLTSAGTAPEKALLQSAEAVFSGSCPTVTHTVTARIVYRDGRWWVAPDRALEKALAGK